MTEDILNPQKVAASVLQLLAEDPRRYRNFGVYWYFIKALLKHYYTRDNLHLLGEHEDPDIIARMPKLSAEETLRAAIDTYRWNAQFNLGSPEHLDQAGELFRLFDPDVGI
jgi:hypothetical protein